MNIEEYCIEKEKAELLKNFILDIDPISNMGGAESAIFTSYCNKKHLFNFKCHICNTEWQGSSYSYIVKELTCPECNENSTHQKIKYASIRKGAITLSEWCDDNKEQGQHIVDEYDDENNELTREEAFRLSYAAHVELNWKCREHGHRWSVTLRNRTLRKSKCPYCAGQRVSDLNSLLNWCLKNKEYGNRYIEEWVGLDINNNTISMEEVSYASTKKVLWRCSICKSVWDMPVCERTSNFNGCPYCRGLRVNGTNSLLSWCTNSSKRGERIISEWTGLDKDGNAVLMEEVTKGSHEEVQWKCIYCRKIWVTTINHRTSETFERNCPYCVGKKVSDLNSISSWCLNNPEIGNIITSQWTGICKDGNTYTMDEVSYASTKRMLWRDEFNHEWYSTIANRTANIAGCPFCNNQTSYAEQYIYWTLKQIYPETANRYRDFKSDTDPQGVEYDVYVKELKLYIEYSPTYWHNSRKERDEYKKQLCEQNNARLIQIIEDSYDEYKEKYTEIFTEDCIYVPKLYISNRDDYLQKIIAYILNSIGHSIEEVDVELVRKNALEYSKGKIEYEKSVEFLHPELAKEWHESNVIKPSEVTLGSHQKIKFICLNCNYGADGSWDVALAGRVREKSGCPRCHYNWYKAETNQPQNIKSQYRKSTTPSKPKPFKYVELSDIDKEMQSWDF